MQFRELSLCFQEVWRWQESGQRGEASISYWKRCRLFEGFSTETETDLNKITLNALCWTDWTEAKTGGKKTIDRTLLQLSWQDVMRACLTQRQWERWDVDTLSFKYTAESVAEWMEEMRRREESRVTSRFLVWKLGKRACFLLSYRGRSRQTGGRI